MVSKFSFPYLAVLVLAAFILRGMHDPFPGSIRGGSNSVADTVPHHDHCYQNPGIQMNLPVFYENLASRMNFPLSWTSKEIGDFGDWKKIARGKVQECMQYSPPEVPFHPVVTEEEDRGDYVAKKIVFSISADSRVLGYMLIPKGEGPFPAVLLLHDHGARFDIGKEKMIRPFKDTTGRMESSQEWVDMNYSGRYLGDELAARGYLCFATDALNWSDRGGAGYDGQQALAGNLMFLGTSLAGLMAYEDANAAEFLSGYPGVDPARIAAVGHSMGGYRTWQVAAMSDHISAGAAICWMATVKGLAVPGNNLTRGNSGYNMLHPGIHRYLDFPDIASLACPKPMLFFNGRQDHLFPQSSVEEAYGKMRKVWDSQGAGSELVTRLWDAGHIFNAGMQEEVFRWLDHVLDNMK